MTLTRMALLALTASVALLGAVPASAQDKGELVIGGSIPLTGVFAFAGKGIEAGMQDYIKIVNEKGGIAGRKLRLAYEDTGYKVDTSVAVFNKLTSQDEIHLYYGDSTAFSKTINAELNRRGTILMTGASFATELNNPEAYPAQFVAGPDYSEMISILLEFIAKEKPGAKLVLVNSDTEFGRDPIAATRKRAKDLGLEIVEEIITQPTSVDVSTEVLKLRRSRPDYTIFHGYVLAPLPEFMRQAKQLNLTTKFMGTFWSMDSSIWADVGEAADGFMGVMPYRYYYDTDGNTPMLDQIRKLRSDYQSTPYMQGFLTAMLLTEAAKRTLDAGKELTAANLKGSLNTIKDFDTGGLIGVPITIGGNSIPVGRIYKYSAAEKKMQPASDWISVKK
jgi:branched-chain amino acid transport system substrate-binding protein